MSELSKDLIVKLRTRTGVGIMDCKKALIEAKGDIEEAVTILRKKGVAVAAKRSDNSTDQGIVGGKSTGKKGALVHIACETDFAAKTDDMKNFVNKCLECACSSNSDASSSEALLKSKVESAGLNLQECLDELISKISESIKLHEVETFEIDSPGIVNVYVHPDLSVATMVMISSDKELEGDLKDKTLALAKDICMQAAVTNPLSTNPDELDSSLVEKERSTCLAQLENSNKPQAMWDKITEGKIKKFYEDVCLIKQKFIKDDKLTIEELLNKFSKENGIQLKLEKFARVSNRK